jgi:hypothetical protein
MTGISGTGAYSVTVGGGSGQGVSSPVRLNVTTLKTNAVANAVLGLIDNTATGDTTIVGGTTPGTYGAMSLSLPTSITGVVINNASPTAVTLSGSGNGQVVYAGIGITTITAAGTNDTIVAGGGLNTINFTSASSVVPAPGLSEFVGDGQNLINVNDAAGITEIVGTSASADTIIGGSTGAAAPGGIYYVSAAGSMAMIDPGAYNATIIGTAGGTETVSVFGVGSNPAIPFTGALTVVNGDGYFQGGSNGGNSMESSTVGGTTLIGGGAGDVLESLGAGDVLKAGLGLETLAGGGTLGADQFWASTSTATGLIAASTLTGTSQYVGASVKGTFIDMHLPGTTQALGSSVEGTVSTVVGSAQFATISDFISGTDKLVLNIVGSASSSVTIGSGTTTTNSGPVAYSTVTTSNGSVFTFLGTTVTTHDIKIV